MNFQFRFMHPITCFLRNNVISVLRFFFQSYDSYISFKNDWLRWYISIGKYVNTDYVSYITIEFHILAIFDLLSRIRYLRII